MALYVTIGWKLQNKVRPFAKVMAKISFQTVFLRCVSVAVARVTGCKVLISVLQLGKISLGL